MSQFLPTDVHTLNCERTGAGEWQVRLHSRSVAEVTVQVRSHPLTEEDRAARRVRFAADGHLLLSAGIRPLAPAQVHAPDGSVLGSVRLRQRVLRGDVLQISTPELTVTGTVSLVSPKGLMNVSEVPWRVVLRTPEASGALTLWSHDLFKLRARAADIDSRIDWRLVLVLVLQSADRAAWWT